MTWISLVCLLALSSSAFGRSTYGSYQAPEPVRDWPMPPRPTSAPVSYGGYGQVNTFTTTPAPIFQDFPTTPKVNVEYGSHGFQDKVLTPKTISSYDNYGRMIPSFDEIIPTPPKPLSPADLLCRGKRPETIIPLEDGRRFVVCLDDAKGNEQTCPKSLYYNIESKRCERRNGVTENPCGVLGCLNGGQCLPFDAATFKCRCAPGFDGSNCELDARVCQNQQPCGQNPGTRCQSFRSGAALEYICIHQNELAYGFSSQQVTPSPCRNIDGAIPLGISDKGFVMCDGERMFVESCPGGTIWDDSVKACVWPDMIGFNTVTPVLDQLPASSGYSYGKPEPVPAPVPLPRPVLDTPKVTSSYGQMETPMISSYGSQPLPKPTFTQPIQNDFRSFKHSAY